MNSATLQKIADSFVGYLPRLGLALATLLGFVIVGRIGARLIPRVLAYRRIPIELSSFFAQSLQFGATCFGIVTALGTLGINISALVAGLGLTSFGIGLAFKDLLSNLVSGMMVLMYRPFRLHDQIFIDGKEGVIEEVNFRYTILRTEKNERVLIPNSKILTDVVIVRPNPTSSEDIRPLPGAPGVSPSVAPNVAGSTSITTQSA